MERIDTREALLEVKDLFVSFGSSHAPVRAVDGVSFHLRRGETLALVGESGSGKSATALSILRLLSEPQGRIDSGEIRFEGRDLLKLSGDEMRALRGRRIAMVFQEPMSALNPVLSAGEQIAETLRAHERLDKAAAWRRAVELLSKVGIADPERRARAFPHQLSGGMRQRVLIAIAIACRPDVLICDEPTTALDVTLQAQILELIRELQKELAMAVLLITHDLGLVAENADRAAVMYAGRIVEEARAEDLLTRPRHPYTILLLRASPAGRKSGAPLAPIPGAMPDARERPSGCRFRTRCPIAQEKCARIEPPLAPIESELASPGSADGARSAACHFLVEAQRL